MHCRQNKNMNEKERKKDWRRTSCRTSVTGLAILCAKPEDRLLLLPPPLFLSFAATVNKRERKGTSSAGRPVCDLSSPDVCAPPSLWLPSLLLCSLIHHRHRHPAAIATQSGGGGTLARTNRISGSHAPASRTLSLLLL